MTLLPVAHAAATLAAHQLLLTALSFPDGSPERLDCAGAATDIVLMLEAYEHLWWPKDC